MNNFIKKASQIRDNIDNQLLSIKDYLESQGVGYRGSLIDEEQFPKQGVDHILVCQKRKQAARLLNDRKRIENHMGIYLERDPSLIAEIESAHPFAMINDVEEDSPAEVSGLMIGDLLVSYGNAEDLSKMITQVVEGQKTPVVVYRLGEGLMEFAVTPRKTETGLLGIRVLNL